MELPAKKKVEVKEDAAPVEEKTEEPSKEGTTVIEVVKDPVIEESPVEETPVEETPAEEAPVEETPEEEGPKEKPASEEKKERKSSKKIAVKEGPFPEELVFGKYNTSEVVVEDLSLQAHINLAPAYVPHSSARHANKQFHKARMSIVERLINNMMRTETYTGKKAKSYKAVQDAFDIIVGRTKENPIQVLVKAIENSAPREEVTRLKFGGISVPKSVDSAPSRRLDIALRNISVGTLKASHKNKKSIAQCLANELMAAAKGDLQSYAVSKRDEVERVAKSAH